MSSGQTQKNTDCSISHTETVAVRFCFAAKNRYIALDWAKCRKNTAPFVLVV